MARINAGNSDTLDVMDTYADIVYCIDLTSSMQPIINRVKEMARTLHTELQDAMLEGYQRYVKRMRVKVIGFRDLYCDAEASFEVSGFFNLPQESDAFYAFLNKLQAAGGGDVPENSLEALALAIKGEWCQTMDVNIRKRHIIVLFTDAPAHRLEKALDGVDDWYSHYLGTMPKNVMELNDWWGQQKSDAGNIIFTLDNDAKRMAIFAPTSAEPWDRVKTGAVFDNCKVCNINPNQGGSDITTKTIIKMLSETLV